MAQILYSKRHKYKILDQTVRVKHFKNVKIDSLRETLSNMDLSIYKNIIVHVGEHDIGDKIGHNSFTERYKQLLDLFAKQNCKVFVSGLIPWGGTNLEPYNDILKSLCEPCNAEFIPNHDLFIMASGELPPGFYHADRINLKFAGTRTLVHNIHRYCPVLPRLLQTENR